MSPPSAYRAPHPLAAAKPKRQFFDAFNSSATGHQRAENRLSGSTSWRDSRTAKLGGQFNDGERGGKRMADTAGAGSEGWGVDGRYENGLWTKGAKGLRAEDQRSIRQYTELEEHGRVGSRKVSNTIANSAKIPPVLNGVQESRLNSKEERSKTRCDDGAGKMATTKPQPPQIFKNLTIYINGSTYPLISDHKLKRLLADHGAHLSIALSRRTITHVILGTPNAVGKGGAGGGLASSKIQKEVKMVRGKGIKFVSVEWVLESIKAGKRLPESRFAELKLALKGQGSVLGAFGIGIDNILKNDQGGFTG